MSELQPERIKYIQKDANYSRNARSINVLDLVLVLVKRRWLIIGTTLMAAILVLAFALMTRFAPQDSKFNMLPDFYRSTTKIMIQESEESLASKLSASGNIFANLLGRGSGANKNIVLAHIILDRNMFKDQIAEEFNFFEKYKLADQEFPKLAARQIVEGSLLINEGEKSESPGSLFTLSYSSGDPVFATQVLNRIVEVLEVQFKDLTLLKVRRRKKFLEERLELIERELKEVQNELESFQLQYGVIDITSQAQEQTRLIANLGSDVLKHELEIQTLREYLREDDPKIIRLKMEIDKKNQLISELKTGFQEYSGESIPLNSIPTLTAEFLSLKGELEVQEKIYGMLRQEYEMVKLEEADNSQIFQIIEPVEVPKWKAGPFRRNICMYVTITAFLISVFWAFLKEYFEKIQRDPKTAVKLEEIKSMLRRKKV